MRSSESSQSSNVQHNETNFYKGMTFKNKEELVTSLKNYFLEKGLWKQKVINSHIVYYFRCAHLKCK